MNNKTIEKLFLIHIACFICLFIALNNVYGFNIFDETYNAIEEYETLALEEVTTVINNIKSNPEVYNMDEYQIADYEMRNKGLVEESIYLLYYYMPAFYILLILLLVLIENSIYRGLKLNMLVKNYDKAKDKNKDKLKQIIIEKLNYKYKRIFLPKHVCYATVALYIASFFITNEIILRTVNNMVFSLALIITVFGIRVAVKFFRTKSEIARFLIILTNVFLSLLVPQMYFIIGFLKSLLTIKVIIKKVD